MKLTDLCNNVLTGLMGLFHSYFSSFFQHYSVHWLLTTCFLLSRRFIPLSKGCKNDWPYDSVFFFACNLKTQKDCGGSCAKRMLNVPFNLIPPQLAHTRLFYIMLVFFYYYLTSFAKTCTYCNLGDENDATIGIRQLCARIDLDCVCFSPFLCTHTSHLCN